MSPFQGQRRCANLRRRSEAQHCSSLCSQSEGHEHVANMTNALRHDFVGFLAVFGRHNIRPPSLCEQSELQCFASDLRRMFARRRLQLCRYHLLIIVICTLNDVPSKRINSAIKQLYALNAEMSIMVESTKVIPALLPKIQKFRRNKRGRLLGFQIFPKRKESLLYERYHLGKR